MQSKFKAFLIISATCSVLLTGCIKDKFSNIVVQPTITLPFGNITISDSSLFALASSDNMSVGRNAGLLTLSLKNKEQITLSSYKDISNLMSIPNQNETFSVPIPPEAIGTNKIEIPIMLNLNDAKEKIGELKFSNAIVKISINGASSRTRITIPEIKRAGAPIELNAGEALRLSASDIMAPKENSLITLIIDGSITGNILSGTFSMTDVKIAEFSGYIGQKIIPTSNVEYSLGSDITDFLKSADNIYFANPSIVISVDNKYGIPISANIMEMKINNNKVTLSPEAGRVIIESESKNKLTINNASTISGMQLSSLFDKNITDIKMSINAITNPNGETKSINHITSKDSLLCNYAIELPVYGVFDNIKVDDTVELDLSGMIKDNVTYNGFRLAIVGTNQMPMSISANATLDKSSESIIDNPILIPSSANNFPVDDPSLIVGSLDESNVVIHEIKKEYIDKLLASKKLLLHLRMSSLGAKEMTKVKMYSPSKANLRVILEAKAEVASK